MPWLKNPTILSLTALGKERNQLLKTLHGFTEEVSQYFVIKPHNFIFMIQYFPFIKGDKQKEGNFKEKRG
jgi:hypothetical protein